MRGGSVLEKFAAVDAIVFDKTGTLTIGKPTVTKVVTQGSIDDKHAQLSTENLIYYTGQVLSYVSFHHSCETGISISLNFESPDRVDLREE